MSTALATRDDDGDPFAELKNLLAPYPSDKYRHLVPTTVQQRSSLWRPSLSVVYVDPDDGRDVYPTPGGAKDSFCLHNQALERIGNASGIDFDPRLSRHVHDLKGEPFICEQFVGGYYTDGLGQRRRITASAKSDLRDGSVTSNVLKGGATTARQFICERTESRARNRCIRKTTNLPSSFTRAELTLPMVAVRYRLDERHPDVRAALIAAGAAASDSVFGSGDGPAIDAGQDRPEDEVQGQIVDVAPRAAEPDVPDDVAAAAPMPTRADVVTAIGIRAANEVKKRPLQERDTPASDDDVKTIGITLRDVLELKKRNIPQPRWKDVRLAVVRILFGVNSARELTGAHVRVLGDMAKDPTGQEHIGVVWAHALKNDQTVSDLAR